MPADTTTPLSEWLNQNAVHVHFQELKPRSRRKNRVILQYKNHGAIEAVGSPGILGAVQKACCRIRAREKSPAAA